jgi:multidrug efflux pump subunit AcrA (membrane-fusion protein)
MTRRFRRPALLPATLAAACVGAVVLAGSAVGGSTAVRAREQTVTVKKGIVQTTVSGSGTLSPSSTRELSFGAGGTVTKVYVKAGQHVRAGQLLARIDPASAKVDLAEAIATLTAAQDALDSAQSSTSTTASTSLTAATAATTQMVAYSEGAASATTPAATATTPVATTTTTPATPTTTTATPTSSTPSTTGSGDSASSSSGVSGSSSTGSAMSVASAEAAVASAKLSVTKARQALAATALRAPYAGTVATAAGAVGDTVSAGSTSASSSGASSAAGADATAGSTSSGFITLAQLSRYTMQVSLSESDIDKVKRGQRATVTVNAAAGKEFAARVSDVPVLSSSSSSTSSSSSAVSYLVTIKLDQSASEIKAGMSATAEIIISQASGLTVPTQAISGGSVTLLKDGKRTVQAVQAGVAGDSTTQILSGVSAGDQLVVTSTAATASSSSASSSATSSTAVGSQLGGGTAAGGGGGFAGGGTGGPPTGGARP